MSGFPLKAGDVILMESSGGGGYGDPLERDAAEVVGDVLEGVISQTKAETVYGVILRDGAVDAEKTRQRRGQLKQARPMMRLHCQEGPEYKGGHRVCRLNRRAVRRLGVKEGDIVEFVSPRGAPLRAWVEVAMAEGDQGFVSGDGLAILGIRDGERVEIRPVLSSSMASPGGVR